MNLESHELEKVVNVLFERLKQEGLLRGAIDHKEEIMQKTIASLETDGQVFDNRDLADHDKLKQLSHYLIKASLSDNISQSDHAWAVIDKTLDLLFSKQTHERTFEERRGFSLVALSLLTLQKDPKQQLDLSLLLKPANQLNNEEIKQLREINAASIALLLKEMKPPMNIDPTLFTKNKNALSLNERRTLDLAFICLFISQHPELNFNIKPLLKPTSELTPEEKAEAILTLTIIAALNKQGVGFNLKELGLAPDSLRPGLSSIILNPAIVEQQNILRTLKELRDLVQKIQNPKQSPEEMAKNIESLTKALNQLTGKPLLLTKEQQDLISKAIQEKATYDNKKATNKNQDPKIENDFKDLQAQLAPKAKETLFDALMKGSPLAYIFGNAMGIPDIYPATGSPLDILSGAVLDPSQAASGELGIAINRRFATGEEMDIVETLTHEFEDAGLRLHDSPRPKPPEQKPQQGQESH